MQKIKFLTRIIILIILYAWADSTQAQSIINQWDLYGYVRSNGTDMIVLKDYIVVTGAAWGPLGQSIHLSTYDRKGELLDTKYFIGENGAFQVGFEKHLNNLGSNEAVLCVNGNFREATCYLYNVQDNSISIENIQDSINLAQSIQPIIVNNNNSKLTILGKIFSSDSLALITMLENGASHKYYQLRSDCFVLNGYYTRGLKQYIDYYDCRNEQRRWLVIDKNNEQQDFEFDYKPRHGSLVGSDYFMANNPFLRLENGNYTIKYQLAKFTITDEPSLVKDWELNLDSLFYSFEGQGDFLGIYNINCGFRQVIRSSEDDAWLYTGSDYQWVLEDSIRYGYGVVGKVSDQGELLWHKRYKLFDENNFQHQINRIVSDGLGGYYLYGTINTWHPDPFYSSAWLLHIDSEGNLTPGTTSTVETVYERDRISIYPNPAKDRIQVLLPQIGGEISIIDQQGKVALTSSIVEQKNLSLDVSQLQSGIYYLRYTLSNGKHLQKALVVI